MAFVVFALMSVVILRAAGYGPSGVAAFVAPPYLPKPERFKLIWVTGDVVAQIGGNARIEARFSGVILGKPHIMLEREGIEPTDKDFERSESGGNALTRFSVEVPSVAGDMAYRVAYKSFLSRAYRITAVEPPRVKSMVVRLTYPKHTGLMPDERKGGGDLRAPYGTRADFRLESTSKIKKAFLLMDGGRETPLAASEGNSALGTLKITKSTRYTVHLVDVNGFENRLPPEYLIESIPDMKPEITLVKPDTDANVPRDAIVLVRGAARDDYGITRVGLHARVAGARNEMYIPLRVAKGRELVFEFPWDLSGTQIFEGDTIEFHLSATDNDSLTGPKTSNSQSRKIHILSRFEDFEKLQSEQQDVVNRMESALGEGGSLAEKFKDLAQNLNPMAKPGEKRQWQADAQRALERQESLEREMADISESMRDTIDRMQKNDLVNLDTLDKMRELNKLMSQIMNEEVRKLIEQIQKRIENMDMTGLNEKMLDAMKSQQNINQSLDQTIQRLKRMRTEQQLEALKEHFRELANRQERLMDNTKELDKSVGDKPPDGRARNEAARQSREEARIKEETASELKTLGKLSQDVKSLSPETADRLDDLERVARSQDLKGNLDAARDQLAKSDLKKAGKHEKKALDSLQRISAGLDSMEDEFQSELKNRMKKMIRAVLRKTLDISDAHKSVSEKTGNLAARREQRPPEARLKSLADEEQLAGEAAASLVDEVVRLTAFSMETPTYAPSLAAEAAASISDAIQSLSKSEIGRALERQNNASLRLNQLAIALLDARKKAGMPSKGSEWDDYMKQLRRLAESQRNLNESTKRLGDSGLPMPQMGQGLRSLALQQKMIREGLGKLTEQMKNMGESAERLSQVGQAMQEVQRELSEARAGEQVRRRQADVLRRLQDLTLSMRKESVDQRRVSERAKEYRSAAPAATRDLVRDALPESVLRELDRLRKEPAPEGYEQLINDYYRELLRGGK